MAAKKYVCNNAKLECSLCTKPEGKLVVTSNAVKLQDKTWATVKDSKKINLQFTGNCKKSYKQSVPCVALIAPTKWINTGEILIQGNKALLECSTIKCGYGGVAIKIKDHIQKSEVDGMQPTDVEGVTPLNIVVVIRLVRKWETDISTIGEFTIDNSDITGFMLEEKGPDTTKSGLDRRVPIGTYDLEWHNGKRFKGVLKLSNGAVPASRAILIHAGNRATDTEGCLLPGFTKGVNSVGSSKKKLNEILEFVKQKGIEKAQIIITQAYE
ncbi:MAG: DUF5675 family protein [Marinirhabdus sp.]